MRMHWRNLALVVLVVVVMLPGCAPPVARTTPEFDLQVSATDAPAPSFSTLPPTTNVDASENPCGVPPVIVPTPGHDPGYARLDLPTGLHVTGKMQLLDLVTYRLHVTGRVEHPLELTYDEIRCLPKVEASPELVCSGLFVDEATWAGVPIADVLGLAGVQDGAQSVNFMSADGYTTSLELEQAFDRANFLAYEWEGQPLPRLHGFPLRVVIPGALGNQWTKWVVEMEVR